MGFRVRAVWLVVAWTALLSSLPVRADDSYEWRRTQELLADQKLELAEAPEHKRIAWVRVVRDDVFVEDEIWPVWWNWFHWSTRDSVVRRELLFEPGGAYQEARIQETMRNMRNMGIFALVRIVAVKTADLGEVGIVVHTRDLWSLRLEQGFNITTQINELLLRATERNLFGRNKTIGADFYLVPKTYVLREFYVARRVWGSDVGLSQTAGVIFNRETRNAEGSVWSLSLGEPFYNLRQRYSYALDLGYTTQVVRQLNNGDVRRYQPDPEGDSAYRIWRQQSRSASLTGFVRRGQRYKQTLGVGWDYRELAARPTAETELPDSLRARFIEAAMPRQRREIGPTASYEIWVPRWTTFVNLATFGQSENVRVGPSASVGVRAPLDAFGSNTNSWVLSSSAGVVLAPGGGLLELRVNGSTRYEDRRLVDQRFNVLLRGATPVFGVFRLVGRAVLEARRNDTTRAYVTLGADNGLRGYPNQAIFGYGASRVLGSVELRTLPIEWQALHVGGVLFYDVGSVYYALNDMRFHQAFGVGIRFLFPQFSRYPFSLDAGMSADPDFRFVPTFSSSQVVPLTAAEDP